jgi:hypothetical protein
LGTDKKTVYAVSVINFFQFQFQFSVKIPEIATAYKKRVPNAECLRFR